MLAKSFPHNPYEREEVNIAGAILDAEDKNAYASTNSKLLCVFTSGF